MPAFIVGMSDSVLSNYGATFLTAETPPIPISNEVGYSRDTADVVPRNTTSPQAAHQVWFRRECWSGMSSRGRREKYKVASNFIGPPSIHSK